MIRMSAHSSMRMSRHTSVHMSTRMPTHKATPMSAHMWVHRYARMQDWVEHVVLEVKMFDQATTLRQVTTDMLVYSYVL